MSEIKSIKVLFVDDEIHNLEAFTATFRRDFEIYTCINVNEALELLKHQEIHVILSDQRMPGITGVEFFELIIPKHPEMIRLLITGYADINIVVEAINKGKIFQYIQKPWDYSSLKSSIEKAFDHFNIVSEEKKSVEELKILNQQLEFIARQNILS